MRRKIFKKKIVQKCFVFMIMFIILTFCTGVYVLAAENQSNTSNIKPLVQQSENDENNRVLPDNIEKNVSQSFLDKEIDKLATSIFGDKWQSKVDAITNNADKTIFHGLISKIKSAITQIFKDMSDEINKSFQTDQADKTNQ